MGVRLDGFVGVAVGKRRVKYLSRLHYASPENLGKFVVASFEVGIPEHVAIIFPEF